MKNQKGQDIIEFALLFPIFLLIICGIMYIGFFFSNYMTLSNLARSAAREATVTESTKNVTDGTGTSKKERDFSQVINRYDAILANEHIITSLYLYQQGSLKINPDGKHEYEGGPAGSLEVVIPMTLNSKSGFVEALHNLGISTKDTYAIVYYMYDEYPAS